MDKLKNLPKNNDNVKPFNMLREIEKIASNFILSFSDVMTMEVTDRRLEGVLNLRLRVVKDVAQSKIHTTMRQLAINRSREIYISNSTELDTIQTTSTALHLFFRSYEEVFTIQLLKLLHGYDSIFGTYDSLITRKDDISISVNTLDASSIELLHTGSIIDTVVIAFRGKFSLKFNLVKEVSVLSIANNINYKTILQKFNNLMVPVKQEVDPTIVTTSRGFISRGSHQVHKYV